ncbi:hypothetical protein [Natronobacterium texcoconense]|uniref:Uncharacterized protein n=1 Tax=Natronobacterium texcoconense TaxID=1095778 RepID=A0A1H1GPH3_NATTX|nr:hypothetical protein [Natronobacterium texcoconense]SDR14766.1 hypothetical protein SAMN04489842_2519 [Natronobacterium texcoconense]
MSHTASQSTVDHLSDRIEAGTERLFRDADSTETLSTTAAELWDVVEELEDLLETVDLEKLPNVIEVSALADLVAVEEVPAALRDSDPDRALDLRGIRHAIRLHDLWNTVDLVDFQRELRHLKDELEDVVGADALDSSGDSNAGVEIGRYLDEVKPEAKNAALQKQVKKGVEPARKAVVDGHSKFETLYESTQRGSGYAGRKPVSKNPTAVSMVPYGPLPASISTRVSTVPTGVRGARVAPSPRVYARRWQRRAK